MNPVNGIGRERRQANRHVLGLHIARCAVPDPLAGKRNDGLAGEYIEGTIFKLDVQRALQHNGNLHELRPLPRFYPTRRRLHPGYADPLCVWS